MLSSKEILYKTGISRATLNNYISLGILSKPKVSNPREPEGPRQLGYFPTDAIERIHRVQQLKKQGVSMSEIVSRIASPVSPLPKVEPNVASPLAEILPLPSSGIRVTLDEVRHPAYMINHNFELVWINERAKIEMFGGLKQLPASSEERNIFRLMTGDGILGGETDTVELHLALAKGRVKADAFRAICQSLPEQDRARLENRFDEIKPLATRPVAEARVHFQQLDRDHKVYACFFREGIFVVYADDTDTQAPLLELLSRRDEVIRNLLSQRMPVLTSLAVLVADLQSSVKICSELPPEEYFELINEIWTAMGPIFRKYHGTCGKHVGDGMLYYFFPQPDSDYLMNALCCSQEMQQEMQRLSKSWQLRKNWLNELYLNTGITEGQEWLGTFESATGVEFVVRGDSINQAARISDFARQGAVWVTKSLIGKLPASERERLRYGVRRKTADEQNLFVASSFSQVSSLLEQDGARSDKLRDIATLAITELVEISD
jgi:adenylate cyclase